VLFHGCNHSLVHGSIASDCKTVGHSTLTLVYVWPIRTRSELSGPFSWPVFFWSEVLRWMRQWRKCYWGLVFMWQSLSCFSVPSQTKEVNSFPFLLKFSVGWSQYPHGWFCWYSAIIQLEWWYVKLLFWSLSII
jgi:hypothetical protein